MSVAERVVEKIYHSYLEEPLFPAVGRTVLCLMESEKLILFPLEKNQHRPTHSSGLSDARLDNEEYTYSPLNKNHIGPGSAPNKRSKRILEMGIIYIGKFPLY